MRREDVLVEVRDKSLARVGTITAKYLQMTATLRHNNVGEWKITLPGKHPMVPYLSQHGSGIIVSLLGSTRFSGPTDRPSRKANRENPDGTFTFKGKTDDILLADARAYPSPSIADPSAQAAANDTRTGNVETLLREYVAQNIADQAPAGRVAGFRSYIRVETVNQNRGPVATKSPRFQNLLELLNELGTLGTLGFQLIQRGDFLMFEVLDVRDVSGSVRFDIVNGTLISEEVEESPPSLTRAIVAGQGEGVGRTIIQRTTAGSVAAEADWGRVIEDFIDQRDTNVLAELQQSGDEKLIEGGMTATSVKVVPADDTTMLYGRDWNEGDVVAVVVNGQETRTTVTASSWIVSDEAVIVGAAIGDVTGFDKDSALVKRVDDIGQRTEKLERTVEVSTEQIQWGQIGSKPSQLVGDTGLNVDNTDFNALTSTGFYRGSGMTNSPDGSGWWFITVQAHDLGAWTLQTAVGYTGSGTKKTWRRYRFSSTWQPWEQHHDTQAEVMAAMAAQLAELMPAGTIRAYGGATVPSGNVLCDGASYSTGAQPALFAALGYSYGGSSGTFNVPNGRGRALVGQDTAQVEFDTLGAFGGETQHVLTSAEMPTHTHSQRSHNHTQDPHNHVQNNHGHNMSDPGHTHGVTTNASNAVFTTGGGTGMDNAVSVQSAKGYTGITAGGTTAVNNATTASNNAATAVNNSTGGGAAHNILQPYLVINYIIKT